MSSNSVLDIVVVGASQADLAVAYCLKELGYGATLFEGNESVGGAWRNRYDSLRLFTPSQYCSLPGLQFPSPKDCYPSKDDVGDYLDGYAAKFAFDVRLGERVLNVERDGGLFRISTARETLLARCVVIATGQGAPNVPAFAKDMVSVGHMHSASYRNPSMLGRGRVLVVGAGNSGAQIAEELCAARDVSISISTLPKSFPQRLMGRDIFWWLILFGMMNVKASRKALLESGAMPLIGSRLPSLLRSGRVKRFGFVTGHRDGEILFDGGARQRFETVIFATGFRPDYPWLSVSGALERTGAARQTAGIGAVPGLFWIGLPWLRSKGSGFLGFVGRDAQYLASKIDQYLRAARY